MADPTRRRELAKFAVQVLNGRWFSVFASFLIMAGAGATYLFGVYSKDIKAVLGYDQTTLNLLGFFKDLGANVGVFSGLIAEVTPTWFVLLVGAAMNFAGYFLIWLTITEKIPKPQIWHMCLFICVGANSQNFANTGALVTCVKNFPEGRGNMLGLLKGYVGLSGAIFTQIYLAIYGNDSKSLVLLIAWLPAALSVVFVYTIRDRRVVRTPHDAKVFFDFLYISIATAVFLMALTVLQSVVKFSPAAYSAGAAVCCLMLFVPFLVAVREERTLWRILQNPRAAVRTPGSIADKFPAVHISGNGGPNKNSGEKVSSPARSAAAYGGDSRFPAIPISGNGGPAKNPGHSGVSPAIYAAAHGGAWDRCFGGVFEKPPRGEDYTILQALLSVDMAVLFLATFCGLGSSLTAVDNLGQIGESLGYPRDTVKAFLSLVSIWNFFGRVFSGFVSEALLVKYKFPRPLMMTGVLLVSCVGNVLIAFPTPGSVYVASVLIGFSFGAQLPLIFAIISELFGLKYYSTLFNCGQLASPIGSYVLNVKVTGMLYDRAAVRQLAARGLSRSDVRELVCIGVACYREAFIILTAITAFGAVASLILVARTRQFYKSDIYERFRREAEVVEIESCGPDQEMGRK